MTKPILFNTQMVRAVLDGRKTVTRRAVKPQPPATSVIRKRGSAWNWSFWADCDMGHLMRPPYQPGDILWVRETWNGDWCDHYIYKADGGSAKAAGYAAEPKWRPSIHMPKEAARLFLRVTDVRVERLLTPFFSDGAAVLALRQEGMALPRECVECIGHYGTPTCIDAGDDSECGILDEIRGDFSDLWNSTIKPVDLPIYGWSANPWVWVISFEKMDGIIIRKTL